MKKRLVVVLLPAILLFGTLVVSSYGYIEIETDGAPQQSVDYELWGSASKRVTNKGSSKIRMLVRRGSYELLVRQADKSYFTTIKSGGFLGTSRISAQLTQENSRRFTGDNPASCLYSIGSVLGSYGCNSSYRNFQVHVPAVASQSTYTKRGPSAKEGSIEGIANTSEGPVIVLKAPEIGEDEGASHTAYLLRDDFGLQDGRALPDLDGGELYSVISYKQGFLVHDSSFQKVYYYEARTSQPQNIALAAPQNSKLKPYALAVRGESIITSYSEVAEAADGDNPESIKARSEVIIMTAGVAKRLSFNQRYISNQLCGSEKLCSYTDDRKLEVYDISASSPKLIYRLTDVSHYEISGQHLLVVRGGHIISLDTVRRAGYVSYSLGDSRYCGLQTSENGYVLCLINEKNKKVALEIIESQPVSDPIDKKIWQLLKKNGVVDVSVYDNFIFITPDRGNLKPDGKTGNFLPDFAVQKASENSINQALQELGIDRGNYMVNILL